MRWRTETDKPSDKRPIVNLESAVMHGVLTCSGDTESLGKTLGVGLRPVRHANGEREKKRREKKEEEKCTTSEQTALSR